MGQSWSRFMMGESVSRRDKKILTMDVKLKEITWLRLG